jgi:uncharacterized protein involved in cysteine biosynthesis
MNIWNKRLGKFYPINQRTKLWMEFSGLTIRQWLMLPLRVIIILPLLLVYLICKNVADWLDAVVDYLLEKLS